MKKTDSVFSTILLQQWLRDDLALESGASVKLAYSGGLDSQVLLHALVQCRDSMGLRLHAIHIDHGLQPQSGQWAEQCRRNCETWNVNFSVERIHVPHIDDEGVEAAARRLRYAALASYVQYGEVLFTAHHQDDQAETLMLQLLRGSGVHGLAAIPVVIPFANGLLARPLLPFGRQALHRYAQQAGLDWIEDASNRDETYARNFLRHRVMPVLQQQWPQAVTVLARAARHQAQAAQLLDVMAAEDLQLCRGVEQDLALPALQQLSAARQANLLRYWFRQSGYRAPNERRLLQVLQQINTNSDSRQAQISWDNVVLWRYRERLHLEAQAAPIDPQSVLPWDLQQALDLPGRVYRLRAEAIEGEGLSQQRLGRTPVTVRWRRGGEICRLAGREHHHKLKKLLQQYGVPPWERARLPLVYAGDELAAVGDRWVCEPYAARPGEAAWRLIVQKIAT